MIRNYYIRENYDILKGSTVQKYEIETSDEDVAIESIINNEVDPYFSDIHVENTDFLNREICYIDTLVEKSKGKNNPFWYFNEVVAKGVSNDGKKFIIESRGSVAVKIEEDSVYLKGQQAIDKALELNLTDSDLEKIYESDNWRDSNWFAIVEVDEENKIISDDLVIAHTYDASLEELQILITNL